MEKISKILQELLTKRQPESHKGTFGHVLVIAGSVNLTGASYLTCMGALRTGTGLITALVPKSIKPIISTLIPEALVIPMSETNQGTFKEENFSYIKKYSQKTDAIALGPGMGKSEPTTKLLEEILTTIKLPMVIDADGLNIISQDLDILGEIESDLVLTPHPGEMSRLVGKPVQKIQQDRVNIAKTFARGYKVTVVLKGHETVIADAEGNSWINPTGNPGMATGGTGDILTGIITSFIAQEIDKFAACRLAVYLHGLTGDIAAEEKGKISLLPRDLIKHIPTAITQLSSQK